VAKAFGVRGDTVARWIREAGGTTCNPTNGIAHGPIAVIELPQEPISYRELANRLGVVPDTIRYWCQHDAIPAHYFGVRAIIYRDEVADLTTADQVHERLAKARAYREALKRCLVCGIVLVNELGEDGSHEQDPDVCDLCMKYARCVDGTWGWRHGYPEGLLTDVMAG
jgi:transposase-like protein